MPLAAPTGLISDVVVVAPAEDVQRSSGVSFDIGSTVGKILYRSNKEYKDGQALKPQDDDSRGQVHYAMFPRSDVLGMISYIKEHCDLKANDQGELNIMSSGVGAASFKKQIETGLNCKLTVLPESDCFIKAFHTMEKVLTEEEFFMPLPQKVQDEIAAAKAFMEEMMEQTRAETDAFNKANDGAAAAPEEDRPRLLVQAGSGTAIMQLNKDGTGSYVDAVFTGGRFMYGLSSFLTGENDFSKLVGMAENADGKTVDLWASDLAGKKSDDGDDDGMYSMPEDQDMIVSPFGKGIGKNREAVLKADLAYATFHSAAMIHAQQVNTSCRVTNASHVYFVGNMFNTPLMMTLVTKRMNDLASFFPPKDPYEVHFIRNGGMLGAMGAFVMTPKEE